MSLEQRQHEFQAAVENAVAGPLQMSKSFGFSNGARFIEGALFVGRPNLESGIDADTQALCLFSMLTLTEEIEIHFAVVIRGDLPQLVVKLQSMVEHQDDLLQHTVLGNIQPYSHRNNNVSFYLAEDGRLYTTSKEPMRLIDGELRKLLGNGISVEHLHYAIYPSTLGVKNHLSVTGLVQDLRLRLGKIRVSELLVWTTQPALIDTMFRMPATLPIQEIRQSVAEMGGVYTQGLVEGFHRGLNFLEHKHFVILSGLSGTGKTSLIRQYAYAIHGLTDLDISNPLFFMCPVRPDWTDPAGLTGHFDIFTNRYIVPTFLKSVLTANAFPNCPVFVCLDEMNLARIEYYFADVLSAIETGLPVTLHSGEGSVPSDAGATIPPTLAWPRNLYIVGTINIDETTHTISDKVLDRAILIDMSETDFDPLFKRIAEESPSTKWSVQRCGAFLSQINQVLAAHSLGFGYRVAEEVIRYHSFSVPPNNEALSLEILDQQLVQKVLVKLRGTERQREMLTSLQGLFQQYPRSLALIQRLNEELAEGWFQATR